MRPEIWAGHRFEAALSPCPVRVNPGPRPIASVQAATRTDFGEENVFAAVPIEIGYRHGEHGRPLRFAGSGLASK